MRSSLLIVALLAGCRGEYQLAPADGAGNARPLAQAGTGSLFRVRANVVLDGRDSFDPDGQIVSYHWSLEEAPAGSTVSLVDADASTASVVPDLPGKYRISLVVEDNSGDSDTNEVEVTVVPPGLIVNAGTDVAVPWLGRAQLSGAFSVEAPFTATYAWTFLTRPPGSSATLSNASSLTPSFIADAAGTYTLALTATSEFETRSDQVVVVATPVIQSLVEEAFVEYSRALDKVLVHSWGSPTLGIHDPTTNTDVPVDLGAVNVTSVSIDPTGLRAAVSIYSGGMSILEIVNLQTATIERTFTGLEILSNVAFGAGNRVHFGTLDGHATLDVVTGNVTANVVEELRTDAYRQASPDGTTMYLLEMFGTDMARAGITTSPMTLQHLTPFTTNPPISDFYFTEDGAELVANGGVILRASSNPAIDLTVRATIPQYDVGAHSLAKHEFAVLTNDLDSLGHVTGTTLRYLDDSTFAVRATVRLPFVNGAAVNPYWIGYRANNAGLLVLARPNFGAAVLLVVPP